MGLCLLVALFRNHHGSFGVERNVVIATIVLSLILEISEHVDNPATSRSLMIVRVDVFVVRFEADKYGSS